MIAKDFINTAMPALKPEDSIEKATDLLYEYKVEQMAVVENEQYLGMVSERNLQDVPFDWEKIGDLPLAQKDVWVREDRHIYDALRYFSPENHIVAVLNQEKQFQGVINSRELLNQLPAFYGLSTEGGIIVLALQQHDYSLGKISQLIESEGLKVLSMSIEPDNEEINRLRLTLRLNQLDLSRIIATLERFGYEIVAYFQESETTDIAQERLGLLMRFLEF